MNRWTKHICIIFSFTLPILISNRTYAENLPTSLRIPPIPSPYRCYSAAPTLGGWGGAPEDTPLGVIWLDGAGNYDSIQNGGGQYGFAPSRGYLYFTSGRLRGWVGVYEVDEYGRKRLRFPQSRGNLPTQRPITNRYNTADWNCYRKTPREETPPWETNS
ncbi:hypothetical protein [Scytonema sp. PRP1]|uniref:hypothetical protein n=1 Tax=Scytonema sp. PRP1 TaxID=3120513 RepID=UPI00300CC987